MIGWFSVPLGAKVNTKNESKIVPMYKNSVGIYLSKSSKYLAAKGNTIALQTRQMYKLLKW